MHTKNVTFTYWCRVYTICTLEHQILQKRPNTRCYYIVTMATIFKVTVTTFAETQSHAIYLHEYDNTWRANNVYSNVIFKLCMKCLCKPKINHILRL